MTFVVTTPSFSGPVELLLQLISSHEVDILDVPLAPIVDAFVTVLKDKENKIFSQKKVQSEKVITDLYIKLICPISGLTSFLLF